MLESRNPRDMCERGTMAKERPRVAFLSLAQTHSTSMELSRYVPLTDLSVAILSMAAAQSSRRENSIPFDFRRSATAALIMLVCVYLLIHQQEILLWTIL